MIRETFPEDVHGLRCGKRANFRRARWASLLLCNLLVAGCGFYDVVETETVTVKHFMDEHDLRVKSGKVIKIYRF